GASCGRISITWSSGLTSWTRPRSPNGERREIGDRSSSSTEPGRGASVRLRGRRGVPRTGGGLLVAGPRVLDARGGSARRAAALGRAPDPQPAGPRAQGVDGAGARDFEGHDAGLHGAALLPGADAGGNRPAHPGSRPAGSTRGAELLDRARRRASPQRSGTPILIGGRMSDIGLMRELWAFMRVRKKW